VAPPAFRSIVMPWRNVRTTAFRSSGSPASRTSRSLALETDQGGPDAGHRLGPRSQRLHQAVDPPARLNEARLYLGDRIGRRGLLGQHAAEPPAQFLGIQDQVDPLLNPVDHGAVEERGGDAEALTDAAARRDVPTADVVTLDPPSHLSVDMPPFAAVRALDQAAQEVRPMPTDLPNASCRPPSSGILRTRGCRCRRRS